MGFISELGEKAKLNSIPGFKYVAGIGESLIDGALLRVPGVGWAVLTAKAAAWAAIDKDTSLGEAVLKTGGSAALGAVGSAVGRGALMGGAGAGTGAAAKASNFAGSAAAKTEAIAASATSRAATLMDKSEVWKNFAKSDGMAKAGKQLAHHDKLIAEYAERFVRARPRKDAATPG